MNALDEVLEILREIVDENPAEPISDEVLWGRTECFATDCTDVHRF